MAKRSLTILIPFLIVTLLCVGGVELLYRGLEGYLFVPGETAQKTKGTERAQQPRNDAGAPRQEIDYSIISRRNLFGPAAPETEGGADSTPAEEEIEASTLDVVLVGTVNTDGDGERAIIYRKKDRSQELYKVGDTVEGALIKDIRRGKVILSVDGRDEMLDISEARDLTQQRPSPVAANPLLRRRPVVVAPQQDQGAAEQAAPRVVRPLRRVVRPQPAITPELQEQQEVPEVIEPDAEELDTLEPEVPEEALEETQPEQPEEQPEIEEQAVQ